MDKVGLDAQAGILRQRLRQCVWYSVFLFFYCVSIFRPESTSAPAQAQPGQSLAGSQICGTGCMGARLFGMEWMTRHHQ